YGEWLVRVGALPRRFHRADGFWRSAAESARSPFDCNAAWYILRASLARINSDSGDAIVFDSDEPNHVPRVALLRAHSAACDYSLGLGRCGTISTSNMAAAIGARFFSRDWLGGDCHDNVACRGWFVGCVRN